MRRLLVGVVVGVVAMATRIDAEPKAARIAFLWDQTLGEMPPEIWSAFHDALRTRGWEEGRKLTIERRTVERSAQAAIAEEMERLKVDVIVASPPSAFALRPGTSADGRRTPVVFAAVSDPVAAKMVATLSRPGGSMTGVSYRGLELNAKRLQLLTEALPGVTRVGVLVPAEHELRQRMRDDVAAAAKNLKVALLFHEVSRDDTPNRLIAVFDELVRDRAQAVLGLQGPQFLRYREHLAELSIKHRLPGIFELELYADAGCLMAYSPSLVEVYRQAADYVDRILRGARPADLPVEQPRKLNLVVNLKTAQAIGLTVPPAFLLRADRVIRQ